MNKKIFGKATALSLAAVTALSAFAMTVSADVTYSIQDQTITGTAVLTTASMSYKTVTYTASPVVGSNGKITVSFPSISGNAPQIVADDETIAYDDLGHSAKVSDANNVYFASTTAANSALTKIKNAASYQNTYGANGTNAFAEWKKSWTDYQSNYNTTYTTTYNATYTSEIQNGTAAADAAVLASAAAASAAQALSAPTATGFVQMAYTAATNSTSVTMTSLKNKYGEEVYVDNLTGAISSTGTGTPWTINTNGSSTTDPTDPANQNTWYPALSAYRKPTTTGLSYQGYNGFWYTSQAAADYYGDGFSGITKTSNYSSTTGADIYFSAADGYYYASTSLAGTSYCYQVASATYSTSYGSYRAANGYYYPTISAAQNASYAYNRSTSYTVYSTTASDRYFSMVTGKFYSTAAAAQAAAPSYSSSYVIDLATYTGSTNDIYNIYDPYYYYFMMGGNNGLTTQIDPDAPAIYGSTKRSGWNTILSVIKTTAKGKTVKVDMNAATTVPDDILTAAKAKGVNLQFVLSNGASWTIKASDIKSANTINVGVTYNTKNIKSSLVSKAKAVNPGAVSTAQISVSNSGSLGVNADVTVKLSSKRAGCTVKAYIKTSTGSLKLVDKAVVSSTGAVTLDINQGGDYLLVVID